MGLPSPPYKAFPRVQEECRVFVGGGAAGYSHRMSAREREMWREESAERSLWSAVLVRLLSACERLEEDVILCSAGTMKMAHHRQRVR